MLKRHLVYGGILCALLTPPVSGERGAGPHLGFILPSAAHAADDSYSDLPTVGGKPTFATRADVIVSTIESLLKAEDYARAAKEAEQLIAKYPEFVQGWLLLGYCRSLISDFTGSNRSYDRALELGADSRTVLMRKAYNFVRMGNYDGAEESYQRILEMNRDDTEVLKQLGYLNNKLGHLDDAALYYRRAYEVDPSQAEVVGALASVEEKRGMTNNVKALLRAGIELEPENAKFLGRLGLLELKENNYRDAIVFLERLAALEPDNTTAYRNIGVAYYHLDNKERAKDAFEKVRERGGSLEGLYGPLAECHMATGGTRQAISVIKEGIEKDEQQAWLFCLWGKILENTRDYDGAIAKFRQAAGLHDEPWSAYAKKEVVRQAKLKKRAQMISSQQGM